MPPSQTPPGGAGVPPPAKSIPVRAAGCQAALCPAWKLSPLAEAPQLSAWMSADRSLSPIPGPPRGHGWGLGVGGATTTPRCRSLWRPEERWG